MTDSLPARAEATDSPSRLASAHVSRPPMPDHVGSCRGPQSQTARGRVGVVPLLLQAQQHPASSNSCRQSAADLTVSFYFRKWISPHRRTGCGTLSSCRTTSRCSLAGGTGDPARCRPRRALRDERRRRQRRRRRLRAALTHGGLATGVNDGGGTLAAAAAAAAGMRVAGATATTAAARRWRARLLAAAGAGQRTRGCEWARG